MPPSRRKTGLSLLCITWVVATAGCDKSKSAPDDKAAEPLASAAPVAAQTPANTAPPAAAAPVAMPANIDPRCPKFRDGVAKAVDAAVTELAYWEPINAGPMRCIYKTADPNAHAAIEIGPSKDLAVQRKGFEQGGKSSDSPLGSHAFRVAFGGLNHVIGNKGNKRIAILGSGEFPRLETLWQNVADSE